MRPVLLVLALAACGGRDDLTPVAPESGDLGEQALSCLDAWERPPELMGPDGFGFHGWTEDDLDGHTFAWPISTAFVARWISSAEGPSTRVHVLRAPDVGQCVQDALKASAASPTPLHDAVQAQTAWAHRDTHLDEVYVDTHTIAADGLDEGGNPLYRALAGALGRTADDEVDEDLLARADAWPEPARLPLARLVLAVQAAPGWRDQALADVDPEALETVREGLLSEEFATSLNSNVHPFSNGIVSTLEGVAQHADLRPMHAGALALARAVDEVQAALADVEPFEGGDITLATPAGTLRLRSGAVDDTWDEHDRLALLVDLGGDDTYAGRAAAVTADNEAVAVVVDVRGADTYGVDIPDLQAEATQAWEAFVPTRGFAQGAAIAGIAVLSDGAGDDAYAATVHAQGSAFLGVGILDDRGGNDTYRVGVHGQGVANFGLAVLRDAAGDDDYRGYSVVQGVGKPGGTGLLLDEGGNDVYAALVQEQEPWLPAEYSAKNYFALPSTWAYGIDGVPHYMSVAQGTGWGYRHEWVNQFGGGNTVWGGGFGALVDLGDGDDVHVADCMSMGQGFVYGMGMLYDDGGDDTYTTFWWGPGASAHMGVGLHWDKDGDDRVYTTRASAGFGYDYGVGWVIDEGGNDTYGGQMHYGRGYQNSWTFFLNVGGDDVYNEGGVRRNPRFGVVRNHDGGRRSIKLGGAFLDLGGGNDTYVTDVEGPGNGAVWHHPPDGNESVVNPELHKGVGIDR